MVGYDGSKNELDGHKIYIDVYYVLLYVEETNIKVG